MSLIFSPQKSCNTILENVRSSKLNFSIQETPYSLFLTIRKSFTKNFLNHQPEPHLDSRTKVLDIKKISDLEAELDILKTENRNLKLKNEHLEKGNVALANNYEEEVSECEAIKEELVDTTAQLENWKTNCKNMEANLKNIEKKSKQLEEKHTKTCNEVKKIKCEKEDLIKENNKISINLKTVKKEAKENNNEHDKIFRKKDETIKELLEYKIVKTAEEKAMKNKQKKIDKKLKAIGERESKLKLEKQHFDKIRDKMDACKEPEETTTKVNPEILTTDENANEHIHTVETADVEEPDLIYDVTVNKNLFENICDEGQNEETEEAIEDNLTFQEQIRQILQNTVKQSLEKLNTT